MQITTFSDYCLRILIFLAVNKGERASAREIAEHYDISVHHTVKDAKWLTRENHIGAVRGKGGGLTLAKPPNLINIGNVIRSAEGGSGLVECMRANGQCKIDGACGLASILCKARDAFFDTLDQYSLADATANERGIAELLKLAR